MEGRLRVVDGEAGEFETQGLCSGLEDGGGDAGGGLRAAGDGSVGEIGVAEA